jgi:transcription elongation factor Elf1
VPYDPHATDDDELEGDARRRRFTEFDCPACNANNPLDDGFGDGDAIRCFYCGQEVQVTVTDGGRLKLRET